MSKTLRSAIAAFLLVYGCGTSAEEEAPSDDPQGSSEATPPETEPGADTAPTTAPLGLPDWATAFEWTENPQIESAGNDPVRGVASGNVFQPQALYFEPRFDNWALVIADNPLENPNAMLPSGTQSVNITDLPAELSSETYRKEFGPGGGFWQIESADDPDRTTSWNAENAYVVEITDWDIEPYDEDEGMFHQAGTASGRLVVVYGRSGEYERSFAYGTFEDIPVRYRGPPRWSETQE